MDRQLKSHEVKKEYLTIVTGRGLPNHGYVDAPLMRDPDSFVKRMVGREGKAAVTEYWRVAESDQATLLKVRLHTGRTHQIRVHMAYLGHPLVGDDMYGDDHELMARQALHCRYLSFYSPFQGHQLTVTAALPADLANAVEQLGLSDK